MIKNETKYDMGKTMNKYIDEFLSNIAFHAPTIWCHGVQSRGPGFFAPITLYLDSPPAVMNVLCRSVVVAVLRNRPIKVINGCTRTPTPPRAACLRPNLLLKIDYFLSILHRHSVSKKNLCQFLLWSILLSISYYFT